MENKLWYDKIKEEWMDALPLGNGRLAAMFFGLPGCERIEINEESLWSGMPLEENYISDADAQTHFTSFCTSSGGFHKRKHSGAVRCRKAHNPPQTFSWRRGNRLVTRVDYQLLCKIKGRKCRTQKPAFSA